MKNEFFDIKSINYRLYNDNLKPTNESARHWGWLSVFSIWANTTQSLAGYTVAASLFFHYQLNGWAVMLAMLVAGAVIASLAGLIGKPSLRYGIPYPVIARSSMGIYGANLPAMIRCVVAIFWYGTQTYMASTAIALLLKPVIHFSSHFRFLGLDMDSLVAIVLVSVLQYLLFRKGMDAIRLFVNWAALVVYIVMLILLLVLAHQAKGNLLAEVGHVFHPQTGYSRQTIISFLTIVGTMVVMYSPVITSYGDFARQMNNRQQMQKGNWVGLLFNIPFFGLIALLTTVSSKVVFGKVITNPDDVVKQFHYPWLMVLTGITFFLATAGINVVANFVPPVNDLSNLLPRYIDFKRGAIITGIAGLIISLLWHEVISQIGLVHFIGMLGALLAPAYGIIVADYFLVKKRYINLQMLYSGEKNGDYYYCHGWNWRALTAFVLASAFAIAALSLSSLQFLSGFSWIVSAVVAAVIYYLISKLRKRGGFKV
ncbi:MAG: cytosine permease [Pseudomonadota bacterium]